MHGQPAGSPPPKQGILFINSPEFPGADTFIHTLIMRGLDRSRFEVHVACSEGAETARTPLGTLSEMSGVRLRRTRFGPSLSGLSRMGQADEVLRGALPALGSLAGLALYIRRNRIAIVHATDRPRDAVTCVLLARLSGAKSIVHAHLNCADWTKRSVRRAMDRADALVGVSRFVTDSLVANGYSAQKTHAVLNAINLEVWDYQLDPGPVRRQLGIPSDAAVVACAARIFRGKGQDDIIRAISLIKGDLPNVRLLIIGEDDRQAMKTSFTDELKALAADLGLAGQVIFTGYRPDMPAVLAASDVFALASFEEPFGLVYAEAMAMKKPVVALNTGGTPEVVEHGRSGLLSAPADHGAFANNLLTLLRDSSLRRRMGEYGRQQVEARFTPERLARDMERVYVGLAPSGANPMVFAPPPTEKRQII